MHSGDQESWTMLAHLLRPQGRKGELLAELHTSPELLTTPLSVFLAPLGFSGSRSAARATEMIHAWSPTGKNEGRIVLQFTGIDSISQAELLEGLAVLIPKSERPEAEEGAEYVEDLIGCQVYDGETLIGELTAIEFSTTPEGQRSAVAAPLLSVVTAQGDEVLIPYVNQFLKSVSTELREIHMNLPSGLLDLNLPALCS